MNMQRVKNYLSELLATVIFLALVVGLLGLLIIGEFQ